MGKTGPTVTCLPFCRFLSMGKSGVLEKGNWSIHQPHTSATSSIMYLAFTMNQNGFLKPLTHTYIDRIYTNNTNTGRTLLKGKESAIPERCVRITNMTSTQSQNLSITERQMRTSWPEWIRRFSSGHEVHRKFCHVTGCHKHDLYLL